MARPICGPSNSVLETDLELAAQLGLIESLAINETEHGYYVTVTFGNASKAIKKIHDIGLRNAAQTIENLVSDESKVWYLTTRRERASPRLHKHLGRLNEFLRDKYPTDEVTLMRNQIWPGKGAMRTRGAKPRRAIAK
jgi:hypothetical protein